MPTDLGHSLGTLLVLGFFATIAWLAIAAIARRFRSPQPDLRSRLDAAFNGAVQASWRVRGGGILPEDLMREASLRGYRLVTHADDRFFFERDAA